MTNLNEIWENIKTVPRIKTLWFDTPEGATEYLENLIRGIDSSILIVNEDDEEIDMDELLKLLNDYRKSQADKLYFRLVKGIYDYITITLECWGLQSDCDCYADVLTFSK